MQLSCIYNNVTTSSSNWQEKRKSGLWKNGERNPDGRTGCPGMSVIAEPQPYIYFFFVLTFLTEDQGET